MRFRVPVPCLVLIFLAASFSQAGTRVRISTTIGDITLELYDQDKPVTVANFLHYIASGRYSDTFFHRLIPGFVVQGGGWSIAQTDSGYSTASVEKFDPIVNEFAVGRNYPNIKGTIAMAKIPAEDGNGNPISGGGPDSATSEWFINLGDNSDNLDNQNGGFTVFGHVVAGMDVLEQFNTKFADQSTGGAGVYDASEQLGSSFTNLPLLAGSLTVGNLVFTGISVVPPSSVSISRKSKIVTRKKAVKVSGSTAGEVVKLQWRLGKKGRLHTVAKTGAWRIRVGGLEKGRNLFFVRGVSADGSVTGFSKATILRK